MPIGISAKKSLRKSIKNNKANRALKGKVHTESKSFLLKPTQQGLGKLFSIIDKAVKKHILHSNKAARLKSQYSKKVNKKDVEPTTLKKKSVKKKSTKKMS